MENQIIQGDCLQQLQKLASNSVDSIVTDPPYGLAFMGKTWDADVPGEDVWRECLRVLKPGGHLLSFGGTRTYHRMVYAIERAGFEIRDMISWVYGTGFPKSQNIGKAIYKKQGNPRKTIRKTNRTAKSEGIYGAFEGNNTETAGQRDGEGWGTALKPAHEPICLARKPIAESSIVNNFLLYKTGGLNIDACRISTQENLNGGSYGNTNRAEDTFFTGKKPGGGGEFQQPDGRFPANLIHDGSTEVTRLFPHSVSSGGKGEKSVQGAGQYFENYKGAQKEKRPGANIGGLGDSGSAARFFYCAKASRWERELGLGKLYDKDPGVYAQDEWSRQNMGGTPKNNRQKIKNNHPTVKPIKLMRYLVRLITPPGGICLDPFIGSGTTAIACKLEGFKYLGIEREPEYIKIATARIAASDNLQATETGHTPAKQCKELTAWFG